MADELFEITHIIPEPPHEDSRYLIPIGFYTKKSSGEFCRFFGEDFDEGVSYEEARLKQLRGEIMAISPVKIRKKDQNLWLGHDLKIYIADDVGEKIKNKMEIGRIPKLTVTHIFPEAPEKDFFCPLTYYCSSEGMEGVFFKGMGRGLNNLEGLVRNLIDQQEENGEILRLDHPTVLPLTADLFLSPEGKIYFGNSSINTSYGMSVANQESHIEIDSSKIPRQDLKIYICGGSHFSTQGNLEDEGWNWILRHIKEGKILRRNESTNFAREIKSFLPENYYLRLVPPVHCPGDYWEFSIPLEKTKDSEAVKNILKKYFPGEI